MNLLLGAACLLRIPQFTTCNLQHLSYPFKYHNTLQNMIGNVCIRSRNWRAYTPFRRQTTVAQSNLLVLSSTILHACCQNPRWSKPQAVYCLRQVMHLVVLILQQLCSLFDTINLLLWNCSQQSRRNIFYPYLQQYYFHFYCWHGQETQVFWRLFEIWFSWKKTQWSHIVLCATLFSVLMLVLWHLRSSYSI